MIGVIFLFFLSFFFFFFFHSFLFRFQQAKLMLVLGEHVFSEAHVCVSSHVAPGVRTVIAMG